MNAGFPLLFLTVTLCLAPSPSPSVSTASTTDVKSHSFPGQTDKTQTVVVR